VRGRFEREAARRCRAELLVGFGSVFGGVGELPGGVCEEPRKLEPQHSDLARSEAVAGALLVDGSRGPTGTQRSRVGIPRLGLGIRASRVEFARARAGTRA